MTSIRHWYKLMMVLGTMMTFTAMLEASSFYRRNSGYYSNDQPEEYLMDLIAKYGQTIMRARNDLENSKRTVDFGLSRGLSGAREAHHYIGWTTSMMPTGPGRKRRNSITQKTLTVN